MLYWQKTWTKSYSEEMYCSENEMHGFQFVQPALSTCKYSTASDVAAFWMRVVISWLELKINSHHCWPHKITCLEVHIQKNLISVLTCFRSYLTPVRDEEAESQRKARSRQARQTRRSTQVSGIVKLSYVASLKLPLLKYWNPQMWVHFDAYQCCLTLNIMWSD